jgi:di/tripeptidase
MIKPTDGANVFKPTFKFDNRQLGIMAAAVKQEWFDILQHMMEEEIRLMNVKLVNSDDEKEVLTAHRLVKGASMFYAGIMQRIAELIAIDAYNQSGIGSPDNPEIPLYTDEFATPPAEQDSQI